jgi:hypothetical protein
MSTKYTTINGELFPYLDPKYAEMDNRITGKDFVYIMTQDIPEKLGKKLEDAQLVDVRLMTEARVLSMYPDDEMRTRYGTHYHSYFVHMKEQLPKTLFWIMNKQPRSITFIVNKIDAEIKLKTQLNMQNGVTTQIVIPETGYSCRVAPVCNKKKMDIFTKKYLCEQDAYVYEEVVDTITVQVPEETHVCHYAENPANITESYSFETEKVERAYYCPRALEAYGELFEVQEVQDTTDRSVCKTCPHHTIEIKMIEQQKVITKQVKRESDITKAMLEKAKRLQDYRKAVQDSIWDMVNFELKEQNLLDEWKMQNIYTMNTRAGFAINAQVTTVLEKYALDMKIPVTATLKVEDLNDPDTYNQMIRIIRKYAQPFGINVKLDDAEQDTMTYMPKHWMRKKTPQDIIPDSVVLKQEAKLINRMKKDSLVDLLNAYIQIDWYMSQPNPEEFYMPGYTTCECGQPIRKVTNAYYDAECDKLYDLDEHVSYKFDPIWGDNAYPVTVCPVCGRIHCYEDFESEDTSYEILEYKLDKEE